jgi:hypothetical protein
LEIVWPNESQKTDPQRGKITTVSSIPRKFGARHCRLRLNDQLPSILPTKSAAASDFFAKSYNVIVDTENDEIPSCLEVNDLGKDEEKGKAEKAAEKTGEVVGKGLKKGFGVVKGVGSGLKKGVKGEDEKKKK